MLDNPIPVLSDALEVVSRVVDAVAEDDWGRPTPCTEWTVRDLVTHMTQGNQRFAAQFASLAGEATAGQAEPAGTSLAGAYQSSAERLLAAVSHPGALEATVAIPPLGDVPGKVAVQIRTVDNLVHGWDLATALGRPLACPEELAARAIEMAAEARSSLPPSPPGTPSPFGPPVPVSPDATALDRLVAMLGRWPAPAGQPS